MRRTVAVMLGAFVVLLVAVACGPPSWEQVEAKFTKGCKADGHSDEACQCVADVIHEFADPDMDEDPFESIGHEGREAFQACLDLRNPDAVRSVRASLSDEEALEIYDLGVRIDCKAAGLTDKECDCRVQVTRELIPDDDIVAAQRSGELNTKGGALALLEGSGTSYEEQLERVVVCALRD